MRSPKPLGPASQFQVRMAKSWSGVPTKSCMRVAPPISRNAGSARSIGSFAVMADAMEGANTFIADSPWPSAVSSSAMVVAMSRAAYALAYR